LNNEMAAADHGYPHNPVPAAVFSEEATLPDSILSSHRYFDHPPNFEPDLPELLSHEWGFPLDTTIHVKTLLRHTLDGHLGTPQFFLMGRQHTDGRAFGMQWNLATCIHTHFPPVILDTSGADTSGAHSALHPFLYGYEGSCQTQKKKRGNYNAVAHG
jgi:hypothetical protein